MSDQPQIDRIPLWLRPYPPAKFEDAGVSPKCHANLRLQELPITVEPNRIECQLRVFTGEGDDEFLPIRDVVIDTGAPFVLFPFSIWSQFEFPKQTVLWLRPQEGDTNEYTKSFSQIGGVLGQSESARIGLIEISFGGVGNQGKSKLGNKLWTDRTVVFAKFMEAGTKTNLKHVLIGMNALQFQGAAHSSTKSRLVVDFNHIPATAFLESARKS